MYNVLKKTNNDTERKTEKQQNKNRNRKLRKEKTEKENKIANYRYGKKNRKKKRNHSQKKITWGRARATGRGLAFSLATAAPRLRRHFLAGHGLAAGILRFAGQQRREQGRSQSHARYGADGGETNSRMVREPNSIKITY
uniref:Uncharacterized protein n=1 Tax=Oryza sativa subsp. japonica TaxID=39947 RepID=Q652S3_ORYSJ|nr:hypothetical protein [Oryza sativa Japonica Group]